MLQLSSKANELLAEMKRRAEAGIEKEQLIGVLTAQDECLYFECNVLDTDEDIDALVSKLEGMGISAMVCMWANGGLDAPSARLRKGLMENEKNGEIVFLGRGEEHIVATRLSKMM